MARVPESRTEFMSQPALPAPRPPVRRPHTADTVDSVTTVTARAPPGVPGVTPAPAEDDVAGARARLQALRQRMAAGGARLNAVVAANGQQLLSHVMEGLSDDEDAEDSSDEETEELWNSEVPSSPTFTTPSATAIAIRNQPAVDFISVEEEERIRSELKDAKKLRKKLRKMRKLVKASMKAVQGVGAATDATVEYFHTSTDDRCTDPSIIELSASAAGAMRELRQASPVERLNTCVSDQILGQMKPITDHAKLVSVLGQQRRTARDRRIRLALGRVDVANEAEYKRMVDVVRDYEEKDGNYKDAFINFREHNSSQLGHMLRCYLLETATYLDTLAATLRTAAGSTTGNYFLSHDCHNKFKDFKVDPQIIAPAPPLFSQLDAGRVVDERLTAKPPPRWSAAEQTAPVVGVPMMATEEEVREALARAEELTAYGGSAYTRSATTTDTHTRRSIDRFLLTGELPVTVNTRAAPTTTGRDALSAEEALIDYIRALTEEYGIEPDIAVHQGGGDGDEGSNVTQDVVDTVNTEGRKGAGGCSRPSCFRKQGTSPTPDTSLILPSIVRGSREGSASSARGQADVSHP
ncbi:hypothetical protein NESM_000116000 [Novymonas esmeraldas]|uniref:Uncharacterized protein n=1 Tax=Novymonas esmeraldas TaxID=1808958 RepID=A0AAW0F5M1_9TRYP